MFKLSLATMLIGASVMMSPVQARMNVLERDGRAVYIRRLGLNPTVLAELRGTCQGICDTLAINAANALLSVTGECVQQDIADGLIDVARAQTDPGLTDKLISLAIEYRQTEKNTPPDTTVSPPILRNSVFCQKAPKNCELNGLVQGQDPANDPNSFFDPAKSDKTIKLGEQPNTFPFASSDNSCEPPSDPSNGDQNGGGRNGDEGAGGNDEGTGGGDDNGAGGDTGGDSDNGNEDGGAGGNVDGAGEVDDNGAGGDTGGDGDNGAGGNDDDGAGGNDDNTGGDDGNGAGGYV